MIEFRNVSKSYKSNQVLQEINLTIYDGETVSYTHLDVYKRQSIGRVEARLFKGFLYLAFH